MVGAKVSIVTHKVQTTRARIRGIAIEGAAQLVFVDTPGLFRPRRRLDRAMVKRRLGRRRRRRRRRPADRGAPRPDRGRARHPRRARRPAARRTTVGARDQQDRPGAGREAARALRRAERRARLRRHLHDLRRARPRRRRPAGAGSPRRCPPGPGSTPRTRSPTCPLRLIAAEITREKLTLRLHQELPYELTVETEGWEERKDGSVRIDQIVYVARDGHKGIALGPKGATIKAVGQAARAEIKAFLGREVHLFLTVKVRPNWLEERERYGEMGLDFRDGDG